MERDEVHEMIEAHTSGKPHHQPPCTFFTEHRSTIYWVLGIIGAVVGYYVFQTMQFQEASIKDRNAIRVQRETSAAKTDLQFKYLIDSVAEIKVAVRDMQSRNLVPK